MTRPSIEHRIRLLNHVWTFHPWHECPDPVRCPRFLSREAALLWLQRFKSDQMAMSTLRHWIKEDEALHLPWRFREDHFLLHFAGLLSRREWHVCPSDIAEVADSSAGGASSALEAAPVPDNSSSVPANWTRPPGESSDVAKTWITIHLLDDDHKPVPRAKYRVVLPDESVEEGVLDDQGTAHIEGIIPGQCQITFPEIDGREWMPH
jgi:hypothetical protein